MIEEMKLLAVHSIKAAYILVTTCECGVIMRLVASVCLSVCPVRALTFDDFETFLICREYLGEIRISRSRD